MSTSDSDDSIDWLASDEDDYDSPEMLSPPQADAPLVPSSSSTTATSFRESPSSCLHSAAAQRRRSDCKDGRQETPAVSPVQGFTSVCKQQTLPVETRKRAHDAALDELCEKPQPDTENEIFSHKCRELQCYVQPLSSILHGLRSGRYSERLSSFQESVAMDRIQRIMGVLQNPNMGGRFLGIILKIEEMLQSWFPHIKANLSQRADSTPAKRQKHHSTTSPLPPSPVSLCSSDSAASYSSTHLRWLHTSPICSLKTPEPPLGRPAAAVTSASPHPRCSRAVTQDNAVSSSTDSHTCRLSCNPRLPFKISSPCLERLLRAKDSIVAPRTAGDGGWLS
ncbi:hypothetical protein PAMP_000091 [Pampus punctatissimus]